MSELTEKTDADSFDSRTRSLLVSLSERGLCGYYREGNHLYFEPNALGCAELQDRAEREADEQTKKDHDKRMNGVKLLLKLVELLLAAILGFLAMRYLPLVFH